MRLIDIKSVLVAALIVAICAGVATGVVLSSGTITLSVTPIYNLSVNISSPTNSFGIVPIQSSRTICIGEIENDGDIIAQWEKRSAASSGGWTLDNDGCPGPDAFSLLAITTTTGASPNFINNDPSENILNLGVEQSSASVTNSFSPLTEGAGSTASGVYIPGTTRHIWTSIMMPTDLTIVGEQTITLSIRAVLP